MQSDRNRHFFFSGSSFNSVIERYNFDRHLRLILFDAIERIEIALRTKMIYHMSLGYGPLWYADVANFADPGQHTKHLRHILKEFGYSREIFVQEHRRRYGTTDPEAWKMLEVISMGTLSKLYKNIEHQLPEKTSIAKGMGLHLHSELSSWLEAIVYVRNIIAHHSRLWSRNMVKRPTHAIASPMYAWLDQPLSEVQKKKPFLIISSLLYLTNAVSPGHHIKDQLIDLFQKNPNVPIYKLGFLNNWDRQPLWIV